MWMTSAASAGTGTAVDPGGALPGAPTRPLCQQSPSSVSEADPSLLTGWFVRQDRRAKARRMRQRQPLAPHRRADQQRLSSHLFQCRRSVPPSIQQLGGRRSGALSRSQPARSGASGRIGSTHAGVSWRTGPFRPLEEARHHRNFGASGSHPDTLFRQSSRLPHQ